MPLKGGIPPDFFKATPTPPVGVFYCFFSNGIQIWVRRYKNLPIYIVISNSPEFPTSSSVRTNRGLFLFYRKNGHKIRLQGPVRIQSKRFENISPGPFGP